MSFMESNIVAEEYAETTASLRLSDGKDSDWMGLERYFLKDWVSLAYALNHASRRRSDTIPRKSSDSLDDLMRAVNHVRPL